MDPEQAFQGHASAFLKSKSPSVDGFGTLMQGVNAEQYKGNKARLSGLVKSEEVTGWAGLWMRVDKGTEQLAFDNMQKRPINGTTGWQRYYVVLDVPKDATGTHLGFFCLDPDKFGSTTRNLRSLDLDVPGTNASEKNLSGQTGQLGL